ncbi:GxxExxY protein [Methanocella sp. MCL-LM]|uniref:GxxExxY protein n=1 Tax=Methanocella sp. MCL-LM TaxID=3412035 RepID=UPI003C78175E
MHGDDELDVHDKYYALTDQVLKIAFKVHTFLGPGLLESAYQECLMAELKQAGFEVESEVSMPLVYNGRRLDKAYIIDLLVDKKLIIELKSVEKLLPVHRNQVKTYLKFSNMPVGLLLNYNTVHLRDGLQRIKNKYYVEISETNNHTD